MKTKTMMDQMNAEHPNKVLDQLESKRGLSVFQMHVKCEVERARTKHNPIHSVHEGYSVILEELEEFWEEVKKNSELRDDRNMYYELVQIAAMAQRTAEDVIDKPTTK